MGSTEGGERTYPLKKPKGHKPPVPRWSLKFPDSIREVYTLYMGVQSHHGNSQARSRAERIVDGLLSEPDLRHPVIDTFRVTNGFDLEGSKCWVAYWLDREGFEAALRKLDPEKVWMGLGNDRNDIGLWIEHFTAPIERLETNYARLDHKPGLAKLPNTEQPPHETTASE